MCRVFRKQSKKLDFYFFRFPFDWKNPTGYLMAFILQCISMLYVNFLISTALCTGIGVYMYTTVFVKDIKNNLNTMNEMAQSKKQRSQLSNQLADTFRTHSNGKELSILLVFWVKDSTCTWPILTSLNFFVLNLFFLFRLMQYGSDIAQPIFMVLFLWSVITICGAMLILNTQIV